MVNPELIQEFFPKNERQHKSVNDEGFTKLNFSKT